MRRATPALCVAALALGGCAPTYTVHGYAPQVLELQQVEAGIDTRGSVQRRLGQPSAYSTFESDVWYYVSSRVEKFAFYRPEVIERTVVVVRFDENGLVDSTSRFGLEDGAVVDLITNTTPTYGRELTILQQIFGNIGRVNAADVLDN
jgi:outer membrane protein assembly factor BamE (lipoprotein component of BamABCDE complex)